MQFLRARLLHKLWLGGQELVALTTLNQSLIRPTDLIPEPKIQPVISLKFRVVEIVVTGRDDVAAPPAFDPFIWIDLPACVIKYGINCHQHEHKERHADMERQDKREDREQPGRADRLYRVKRKARPRRWLHAAVMAFMSPFEELAVVHDTVGKIKPRILEKEIN